MACCVLFGSDRARSVPVSDPEREQLNDGRQAGKLRADPARREFFGGVMGGRRADDLRADLFSMKTRHPAPALEARTMFLRERSGTGPADQSMNRRVLSWLNRIL